MRVAHPPADKPILIFDGACGFCRKWINRWKYLTQDRINYATAQDCAARFPEIPQEAYGEAVQFIETNGEVASAAHAVFRALAYAPGKRWMLFLYEKIPGAAPLAERVYRFVAQHRRELSGADACPAAQPPQKSSYHCAVWLFLRLLALSYLIAFVSLWCQIEGLIGKNGIWPVHLYLESAGQHLGAARFWQMPALLWLFPQEAGVKILCALGAVLSLALFFGLAQKLICFLLWAFYLSLVTAGGLFLGYQWDNLLLEAGFLAIFLTPNAALSLWLLRLLLFKLIFSSGMVKLTSHDPAWRALAALNYHYETQPIPNLPAWYAHQGPLWMQKISTAVMFIIELVCPWLIFASRSWRLMAALGMILLQILIAATGNYCFFNLLTMALCVLILDDQTIAKILPKKLNPDSAVGGYFHWKVPVFFVPSFPRKRESSPRQSLDPRLRGGDDSTKESGLNQMAPAPLLSLKTISRKTLLVPVALLWLLITGIELLWLAARPFKLPSALTWIYNKVAPFRTINSYGLFAVMTTTRPEIIIEGSLDGKQWLAYEFKYKPGDLKRPPPQVAPHQPRLDWQMWFAALGSCERNPWLINFLARLLQGEPAVLRLLKNNPFPEKPPVVIRTLLYQYRFTNAQERKATGQWWKRELQGAYCPPIALKP